MNNCTHTFARLPVSVRTFREIADKLRAADYGHCFLDDAIDMNGIALVPLAGACLWEESTTDKLQNSKSKLQGNFKSQDSNQAAEDNTDACKLQIAIAALKDMADYDGPALAFRAKALGALEAMRTDGHAPAGEFAHGNDRPSYDFGRPGTGPAEAGTPNQGCD